MVVLKFGGTSVADADAIRGVVEIVDREERPRAVVVSALAGVTDRLLVRAAEAAAGASDAADAGLEELRRRHVAVASALGDPARRRALEAWIDGIAATVAALARQARARRACTPAALDEMAAAGELWRSRLLAAMFEDAGLPVVWIDARRVVRTDGRHTGAAPDGTTTTLGRGGSDCSAAVIRACLDAEEIQIWTDVVDALRRCRIDAAVADLCGSRLSVAVGEAAGVDALAAALSPAAQLRCRSGLAMVCAVGERLRTDRTLVAEVVAALGDFSVPLISQPSGARTLAVVVDASQAPAATARLHDRFFGDPLHQTTLWPAGAEA